MLQIFLSNTARFPCPFLLLLKRAGLKLCLCVAGEQCALRAADLIYGNRKFARLFPRQIDENNVRVLPHPVEDNLPAIR